MFNTFFLGAKIQKKKKYINSKKACTLNVFCHKKIKSLFFRPNNCISNVMNIAIFTIIKLLIIIIFYRFLSKHTTDITFLSCNFF